MPAFGAFNYQNLPYSLVGGGLSTDVGTLIPPGSRVACYLRSTGAQDYDDPNIATRIVTTLNAACAQVRSGLGDVVLAMPGHTESISSADKISNLVAGTKIIGLGSGNLRPTFTWTAATATFLFDVPNCLISNCILKLCSSANAGVTVAAPITVSAAGCGIIGNRIEFGADSNDIVTIGITTTAAADQFNFSGNHCVGATTAECTTFLQLVGADDLIMQDNYIAGATSSTAVGIVRFATTASLDIELRNNVYINRKALSTCAVTGLDGVSGVSHQEHFAYLDTASLTPWLTSTGIMTFHRPTVTNTAGETGTEVVGVVSASS